MTSSTPGPLRKIGSTSVPSIGYGAMGLAAFYGEPKPQAQVDEVFKFLLSKGVTHVDTSDIYSSASYGKLGENETQIANFLRANPGSRDKLFIATKHAMTIDPSTGERGLRGGKDYAISALNDSLKRLGVDHVDLFYHHRPVDAEIEGTMQGMQQLKQEGKTKYIGVSEYNIDQLNRAEKVAHIDALQIELSPQTPNIVKNGILDWCKRNGTTVVAYSPLGRGLLSGKFDTSTLDENDFRRASPRFAEENFKHNKQLVEEIKKVAEKKSVTPGQVSLAWVLAQGENVVAIPGSTKVANIEENVGGGSVQLSPEELAELDEIIHGFEAKGGRYPEAMASMSAF